MTKEIETTKGKNERDGKNVITITFSKSFLA